MPLRERKKAKTRELLIQAAMTLFSRKGFDETTIDEIVEAAEVSRRTFFRYFAAKELIAFPHQQKYVDKFRALLAEKRPDKTPFAKVRIACLKMAALYMEGREEHLAQWRIIQSSPTLIARGDQFDIEWETAIAECMLLDRETTPVEQRQARFRAAAIMGVIRAVILQWYESECRADLFKLGEEAFDSLEKGYQ